MSVQALPHFFLLVSELKLFICAQLPIFIRGLKKLVFICSQRLVKKEVPRRWLIVKGLRVEVVSHFLFNNLPDLILVRPVVLLGVGSWHLRCQKVVEEQRTWTFF